jgi:hypothetical protein
LLMQAKRGKTFKNMEKHLKTWKTNEWLRLFFSK